jgi:hypothetical protein
MPFDAEVLVSGTWVGPIHVLQCNPTSKPHYRCVECKGILLLRCWTSTKRRGHFFHKNETQRCGRHTNDSPESYEHIFTKHWVCRYWRQILQRHCNSCGANSCDRPFADCEARVEVGWQENRYRLDVALERNGAVVGCFEITNTHQSTQKKTAAFKQTFVHDGFAPFEIQTSDVKELLSDTLTMSAVNVNFANLPVSYAFDMLPFEQSEPRCAQCAHTWRCELLMGIEGQKRWDIQQVEKSNAVNVCAHWLVQTAAWCNTCGFKMQSCIDTSTVVERIRISVYSCVSSCTWQLLKQTQEHYFQCPQCQARYALESTATSDLLKYYLDCTAAWCNTCGFEMQCCVDTSTIVKRITQHSLVSGTYWHLLVEQYFQCPQCQARYALESTATSDLCKLQGAVALSLSLHNRHIGCDTCGCPVTLEFDACVIQASDVVLWRRGLGHDSRMVVAFAEVLSAVTGKLPHKLRNWCVCHRCGILECEKKERRNIQSEEVDTRRDIEQHAVTATRFWMTPAAEKYHKKLSQLSQISVHPRKKQRGISDFF